jgi:hypothetical protein
MVPWIYIILGFPVVGPAIYFLAVILPDYRHTRDGKQLATGLRRIVDPDGELRDRVAQAEMVDSLDAKRGLADELMHRGDYPQAAQVLERALVGVYRDDPGLLYALARARFGAFDYLNTLKALDALRTANPDWQSADAHLLYARALEGEGREAEALAEYEAVSKYFAGEEARCRLALFLQKLGRADEARQIWLVVGKSAERASRFQRDMQSEWYALAKRNLAN